MFLLFWVKDKDQARNFYLRPVKEPFGTGGLLLHIAWSDGIEARVDMNEKNARREKTATFALEVQH